MSPSPLFWQHLREHPVGKVAISPSDVELSPAGRLIPGLTLDVREIFES